MKYLSGLLFLIFNVHYSQVVQQCDLKSLNIKDKEGKFAAHFDRLIKDSVPIAYECLELLIQRGYYQIAVDVYDYYFMLNQIDVSKELKSLLEKDQTLGDKKELEHIFTHAMSKNKRIQTVQPVINWAQSRNHTLINIKFSHRVDAPACINAKIENITMEGNKLLIRAFGVVSHFPIRYEAIINLYKPINPQLSKNSQEAVGTMVFNLTKEQPNDLWIRLTTENIKVPIWWDLSDNLKEDMDDYFKILEKVSDKSEKNSDQKYRKKQKERAQQKLKQERLDLQEQERQRVKERNQCSKFAKKCEVGWYQRQ